MYWPDFLNLGKKFSCFAGGLADVSITLTMSFLVTYLKFRNALNCTPFPV